MSRFIRIALTLAWCVFPGLLCAVTMGEAQELFRSKRYAEARGAFEQLAAAEPNNAEVAFRLGLLAIRRDAPEDAVTWLEKATGLSPRSAPFFQALGDAYGISAGKAGLFLKLGFARKCRIAYEQAVSLDPENIEARYSLFTYCRQAPAIAGGGLDKARVQALEIRKRDVVQGSLALVELSVAEKKFDDAFGLLEDLRRTHPEAVTATYQIGRTAAMSGLRLDQGEVALKEYLAQSPDEDNAPLWAAHWRLGQILQKKGDPAAARSEFETALKLNPTQPQLLESMRRLNQAAPPSASSLPK
jgi:tetratricopeptide (TPR) repeat protein